MRVPTFFRCVSAFLATAALAVLFRPAPAPAQETGRRRPAPELSVAEKGRLKAARSGRDAGDDALMTKAAQYFVNRLTDARYHPKSTATDRHLTMHDLVKEAVSEFAFPTADRPLDENEQRYMTAFTKALVVEIREVLHSPEPIAQVNAALLLAYLGKAGQDEAADLMVEILDPAKQYSDAVKIHALHGLENLFAVDRPKPQKRELDAINALLDFVKQKPKLARDAPHEEVEAVRYLRRQAIRALGRTRLPGGPGGTPPTALLLLRFLHKDGFTPEPSMSERVEAALAVCRLHPKLYSEYQPAYAVRQVSEFLVDFANAAGEDLQRTGRERPPSLPWKYDAALLIRELDALRDETEEKKQYVVEVTEKAKNLLNLIKTAAGSVDASNFRKYLDRSPLPADVTTLYKDVPNSVVKPPASSEK